MEAYSDYTVALFTGRNTGFYAESWSGRQPKLYAGWNWAAFFFGTAWLLYRKMYVPFVVFTAAALVVQFVPYVPGRLMPVLIALWGNALYHMRYRRVAAQAVETDDPEGYIRSRGGTNPAAAIVLGVVWVLAFVLERIL